MGRVFFQGQQKLPSGPGADTGKDAAAPAASGGAAGAAAVKDRPGFRWAEVMPGVTHIEDPMGVCTTLLAGRERAMLVDAGYPRRTRQAELPRGQTLVFDWDKYDGDHAGED